ncbi:hemolysin-III related-domain-containing protein [Suillus subaureus]|uniref:Hemolysin-III related-domain-containing protein n=1 Tax=Suillus subaureus TaxID=48587 RepID=A0A9P7E5Y4_9AGAM|nr:hemolysin-III related-domain-containing protein [Suillus subaureus]KAG1812170.1 hemolysin-III related-domain-containing protein [Suillus subaureus]
MSSTATDTNGELRPRHRRRFSTNDAQRNLRLAICQRLPHSLEALDLSSNSAKETFAALRYLVLSYLEDIEMRLAKLESPITPITDLHLTEALKTKGGHSVEEARQWAKDALEMLRSIRMDVCSHFPDLHLPDMSPVKSHLPELPDVPSLSDVRSRLPDIPSVRPHIAALAPSDITLLLEHACSRFSDFDFSGFLPTLSARLHSFHAHLRSFDPRSSELTSLPGNSRISGLIDSIMSSELITELSDDVTEAEAMIEVAAKDIARAVKQSFQGSRLIKYVDLPPKWRNNPFVPGGYRFIPLERWPLILMSLFAVHNETLNIHTHLIPFVLWLINLIPIFNASTIVDAPEVAFISFALLCLFSSVVWHTMAGCAHPQGMELCARIDYVGIGWLISASVGTVVYYGFQKCHPEVGNAFLVCCFMTGIAGNAFPFFKWFDQAEYKHCRIAFFLSLAFTAAAPMTALAYLQSPAQMFAFVNPIWPSITSYLIGLIFYATHIPERFLSERHSHWLDWCGGGSHAIWHIFIVIAISQHRAAIAEFRHGVECHAVS